MNKEVVQRNKPLSAESFSKAIFSISTALKQHQRNQLPTILPETVYALAINLREPLERQKAMGGLINPWALAGLKRNEVRTTAALCGLWSSEFGGDTSRKFLAFYLGSAIDKTDHTFWVGELQSDYSVIPEVNPLGDISDRIDVVIQTRTYLIGIEVKIDAPLQYDQLGRYLRALEEHATNLGKDRYALLFLATTDKLIQPRQDGHDDQSVANFTPWRAIGLAAKKAAEGKPGKDRTFIENFIASFGDHVDQL